MPFFRLIARILTFRDKKYRILTFRDKTESFVFHSSSLWLAVRLSLALSGCVGLTLACCLAVSGSLWLTLALFGSLSGSLWISLVLSGSLSGPPWLSLARSGSLLLSEFAYKALAWLTRPLLGSEPRS